MLPSLRQMYEAKVDGVLAGGAELLDEGKTRLESLVPKLFACIPAMATQAAEMASRQEAAGEAARFAGKRQQPEGPRPGRGQPAQRGRYTHGARTAEPFDKSSKDCREWNSTFYPYGATCKFAGSHVRNVPTELYTSRQRR